jgi:DNA topoisomerase VI subunit B
MNSPLPGPSVTISSTVFPCSNAKLPIVEKTMKPHNKQVNASTPTTICKEKKRQVLNRVHDWSKHSPSYEREINNKSMCNLVVEIK